MSQADYSAKSAQKGPFGRLGRPLRAVVIAAAALVLAAAAWGAYSFTRPAPLPRLVYFSAPACSACSQVAPLIDQVELEYAGLIEVERVSMMNRERMAYYNAIQPVYLVPTVFLLDGRGQLVWSGGATLSYEQIVGEIKSGTGIARP